MRDIMQGYSHKALCAAAGVCSIATILGASLASAESVLCLVIFLPILSCLCFVMAMRKASKKVNSEILNPKGMTLQQSSFLYVAWNDGNALPKGMVVQQYKIVSCTSSKELNNVQIAVGMPVSQVEFSMESLESQRYNYCGKRERERAPANYGTVEMTHSCKSDVAEEVVRSLYSHMDDGATRSERVIACSLKIVYVPEEDLQDLAQVYNSKEMGELRTKLKSEVGARRCLRFFYNNGSSLAADKDQLHRSFDDAEDV
jgi:hypothetical protein